MKVDMPLDKETKPLIDNNAIQMWYWSVTQRKKYPAGTPHQKV